MQQRQNKREKREEWEKRREEGKGRERVVKERYWDQQHGEDSLGETSRSCEPVLGMYVSPGERVGHTMRVVIRHHTGR